MSLDSGSSITWEDILALYTTLRASQSEHGIAQTAIPSGGAVGSKSIPAHVTPLLDGINAMKSEQHFSGLTIIVPTAPATGNLITSNTISSIASTIDSIAAICHNNSGCFGFGFCSSFNSFSFRESGCGSFGH